MHATASEAIAHRDLPRGQKCQRVSETDAMKLDERMSAIDRAWLLMERPTNPMMIVGLIILDGRLDHARLRRLVSERFLAFDLFRYRPVSDAVGARWVEAAEFDIHDHVLRVALPGAAQQRELETLVAELASNQLSPIRARWTFHLIENYRDGSAIVVRIHHCYADGIALVRVLLSFTDAQPSAAVARGPSPKGASGPHMQADSASVTGQLMQLYAPVSELMSHTLQGGKELLGHGVHYALHPIEAAGAAREALAFGGELVRLATLSDDPATRLKQSLSGVRRVSWAESIPLEEVTTIGHLLGCTINDVVATLAGALGRYLEAHGDAVHKLTIRAAVPVNARSDDDSQPSLGNRFGLIFVDLPIGIRHPLERLYAVHAAMITLKKSPQALLTLGLLTMVGRMPLALAEPVIEMFSAKASLVASNLPGPQHQLYMANVPVSQLLFWVPQAGSIGTGVSMLTYNGAVQFGVISDRRLVPKPAELVHLLNLEFERLLLLVLLGAGSLAAWPLCAVHRRALERETQPGPCCACST
jgi:diacylglycerol O-acyltransferase